MFSLCLCGFSLDSLVFCRYPEAYRSADRQCWIATGSNGCVSVVLWWTGVRSRANSTCLCPVFLVVWSRWHIYDWKIQQLLTRISMPSVCCAVGCYNSCRKNNDIFDFTPIPWVIPWLQEKVLSSSPVKKTTLDTKKALYSLSGARYIAVIWLAGYVGCVWWR